MSIAKVSVAIVSIATVSTAIVSKAIVSIAIVSIAIVSTAAVSIAIVSIAGAWKKATYLRPSAAKRGRRPLMCSSVCTSPCPCGLVCIA